MCSDRTIKLMQRMIHGSQSGLIELKKLISTCTADNITSNIGKRIIDDTIIIIKHWESFANKAQSMTADQCNNPDSIRCLSSLFIFNLNNTLNVLACISSEFNINNFEPVWLQILYGTTQTSGFLNECRCLIWNANNSNPNPNTSVELFELNQSESAIINPDYLLVKSLMAETRSKLVKIINPTLVRSHYNELNISAHSCPWTIDRLEYGIRVKSKELILDPMMHQFNRILICIITEILKCITESFYQLKSDGGSLAYIADCEELHQFIAQVQTGINNKLGNAWLIECGIFISMLLGIELNEIREIPSDLIVSFKMKNCKHDTMDSSIAIANSLFILPFNPLEFQDYSEKAFSYEGQLEDLYENNEIRDNAIDELCNVITNRVIQATDHICEIIENHIISNNIINEIRLEARHRYFHEIISGSDARKKLLEILAKHRNRIWPNLEIDQRIQFNPIEVLLRNSIQFYDSLALDFFYTLDVSNIYRMDNQFLISNLNTQIITLPSYVIHHNAIVCPIGAWNGNNSVINHTWRFPQDAEANRVQYLGLDSINNMNSIAELNNPCFFMRYAWGSNYQHFLTEIFTWLPLIIQLKATEYPNLELIILDIQYQRDALSLVLPGIILHSTPVCRVKTLITCPLFEKIWRFRADNNEINECAANMGITDRRYEITINNEFKRKIILEQSPLLESMKLLRNALNNCFIDRPINNKSQRIYLDRDSLNNDNTGKRRCCINGIELWEALKCEGFERVCCEQMNFQQKYQILSGAECVLTMHGANVMNLVLAESISKIIIFSSPSMPAWLDLIKYWVKLLSHHRASIYFMPFCPEIVRLLEPNIIHLNQSFRINVKEFVKRLREYIKLS